MGQKKLNGGAVVAEALAIPWAGVGGGGLGAVLAHQVCAEMPSIRQEDGDFASPLINQRLKAGCSRERG